MSAFDDRTQVATVTCPNGHHVKINLGQARRSQTVRCSVYSAAIVIDGRSLDQSMRGIDREFANLKRTLKRLGR